MNKAKAAKEGREHSPQTFFQAMESYIVEGLSYLEVAAGTGVSRTQVQRWAVKHDWKTKRESYLEGMGSARIEHLDLIQRLQKELKQRLDGQLLFAYRGLVKDFMPKKTAAVQAPDLDRPALFLEDLNFIATILKEIDPEGLKIMSRNFDAIVSRFKADHAKTA